MIVTVTLNAALDVTYEVPRLEPHTSHRVRAVWRRGGGKGVNVARLLGALGARVVATGLAGGPTGAELIRELVGGTAAGPGGGPADRPGGGSLDGPGGAPRARFHPIAGESRRCVTVVSDGDATVFNEPGPEVSAAEWEGFGRHFAALLAETGAGVVVLSGSLPRGLPGSAYGQLAAAARRAGARVVLDAGGAALRHGLAGKPDVVKPNRAELAAALPAADVTGGERAGTHGGGRAGTRGDVPAAVLRGARALRAAGAGAVVTSCGPDGLVAVTAGGTWAARPPERLSGNPTGAGDAVAAALALALARGTPWPEAMAMAVALSAAAVLVPVAGAADLDAYRRWRPAVRVDRLAEG